MGAPAGPSLSEYDVPTESRLPPNPRAADRGGGCIPPPLPRISEFDEEGTRRSSERDGRLGKPEPDPDTMPP